MDAVTGLEPLRAGIEDFLPLLMFLVIWWVSSRMAEKKRSLREGQGQARTSKPVLSEPSKSEEVSPLDVLRQMLFGELEMPPIPPSQPQPAEAPLPEDFGDAYREDAEWQAQPPLPPAPAERTAPAVSLREELRRPPIDKVTPPAMTKPKPERAPLLLLARTPRHDLQRAVAWSEIIAPPVSLRNESP